MAKPRSSKLVAAIRALHLDLKGVPPTFKRLLRLVEIASAAGYNALLVEWEDMFPWTVDKRFRSSTAYTPQQVRRFHQVAAENGLEIIPLVQCLGHMENPLSLPQYKKLREIEYNSSCINPLAPGSRELVEKMIDDVLALTPGVRYFHLGGDEAAIGANPRSAQYARKHGKGELYLHHVGPLLDKLNARGIRPILWSDMMSDWSPSALRSLSTRADLCPWGYHGEPAKWPDTYHTNLKCMKRFKKHGIRLWGASAYKGAGGVSLDESEFALHQENSLGWAKVAAQLGMVGLVATAWSRYSTHRTQTQPIDACLDSLVNVGSIIRSGKPLAKDRCVAILGRLGEKKTFLAAAAAMARLAQARRGAWYWIQLLREQIAMESRDVLRRQSAAATYDLKNLRQHVIQMGDEASKMTRKALSGLIAPMWIEHYLADRLEPLREELSALEARVRALEPQAFAANK